MFNFKFNQEMKTIYKYQITICDRQEIEIPRFSEILHVQMQSGSWYVWVLVDTDEPMVKKRLRVFGTGHEIPKEEDLYYVMTFQQAEFMWHLFEVGLE